MKKVLAFVLVLGMATVANAALTLQVSTDGGQTWNPDPQDSDIILQPTDVIWIGVHSDTGGVGGPGMYNAYVFVRDGVSGYYDYYSAVGEWYSAQAVSPPAIPEATAYVIYPFVAYMINSIDSTSAETFPGIGGIFEFHCTGIGPVIIEVQGTDGSLDQILIHQIPEPMTMALLGLGGLGLLRRRR